MITLLILGAWMLAIALFIDFSVSKLEKKDDKKPTDESTKSDEETK
jgi:hypothetical protein